MDKKIPPFLFLDIETTGHDPLKRVGDALMPWHEIIDIGAVLVDQRDLVVLGEFNQKIMPEHPERCLPNLVNDYLIRASEGEWEGAPPLSEAIERLFHFVAQWEVAVIPEGHNFFFDWSFLQAAFAWCGVDEATWQKYFHYTRLDTRSMAFQELSAPDELYDPSEYSLRNSRLAERLGIAPEPYPHIGINGAYQAYEVHKKIREIKRLRWR